MNKNCRALLARVGFLTIWALLLWGRSVDAVGFSGHNKKMKHWENTLLVEGERFRMISAFTSENIDAGLWLDEGIYLFGRISLSAGELLAPKSNALPESFEPSEPPMHEDRSDESSSMAEKKSTLIFSLGHLNESLDEGFTLSDGGYRPGFYSPPWSRPLGATIEYGNPWFTYRLDSYLPASSWMESREVTTKAPLWNTLHSLDLSFADEAHIVPGVRYFSASPFSPVDPGYVLFSLSFILPEFSAFAIGGPDYGALFQWEFRHSWERASLFWQGSYHLLRLYHSLASGFYSFPEVFLTHFTLRSSGEPRSSLSLSLQLQNPVVNRASHLAARAPYRLQWKVLFLEQSGIYGLLKRGETAEASWPGMSAPEPEETALLGLFFRLALGKLASHLVVYLFPPVEGSVVSRPEYSWRISLQNEEFAVAWLGVVNRSGNLIPVDPLFFDARLREGALGSEMFLYSDTSGEGVEAWYRYRGLRMMARLLHNREEGIYGQFDGFLRVGFDVTF